VPSHGPSLNTSGRSLRLEPSVYLPEIEQEPPSDLLCRKAPLSQVANTANVNTEVARDTLNRRPASAFLQKRPNAPRELLDKLLGDFDRDSHCLGILEAPLGPLNEALRPPGASNPDAMRVSGPHSVELVVVVACLLTADGVCLRRREG
jgi:hypothetical protein